MKTKLMKDFNKLLKLARKVLGHYFDEAKIDQIIFVPLKEKDWKSGKSARLYTKYLKNIFNQNLES